MRAHMVDQEGFSTNRAPLLVGTNYAFYVDVFVTSKDILMYIIIVCCCTPIGYLCFSFHDFIIVYRDGGTTSIVSRANSP